MNTSNEPSKEAIRAAREVYQDCHNPDTTFDGVIKRWAAIIDACFASATPPATVAATVTPPIRDALEVAQIVLDNFASLASWAGGDSGNEWIWAKNNEPYAQAEAALKVIDEALAGVMAEPAGVPALREIVERLRKGKTQVDNLEMDVDVFFDELDEALAQLESAAPPRGHEDVK